MNNPRTLRNTQLRELLKMRTRSLQKMAPTSSRTSEALHNAPGSQAGGGEP